MGGPLQAPETSPDFAPSWDLEDRVLRTLALFSQWGHAATVESLGQSLLGGAVEPVALRPRLGRIPGVTQWDGIVGLQGREDLMAKTERRIRAHSELAEEHLLVAREYTRDLMRWCPYVQCVALTGSLASGGFQDGDDIDFDLFVEDGTKYITYLVGTLLGLRYSWRFRHRDVHPHHATPLLPKITCLNVVWTEGETRPFVRHDVAMAYELLRCVPLAGHERFDEVLHDNRWLEQHFPQIYRHGGNHPASAGTRNLLGRFLDCLHRYPRVLRLTEGLARTLSRAIYRFVQGAREDRPEAVERMEFLRKVKFPYEFFQESG